MGFIWLKSLLLLFLIHSTLCTSSWNLGDFHLLDKSKPEVHFGESFFGSADESKWPFWAQMIPQKLKSAIIDHDLDAIQSFKASVQALNDSPVSLNCITDILTFLDSAVIFAEQSQIVNECSQTKPVNKSCILQGLENIQRHQWIVTVLDSFGKIPSGILEGNFWFLGNFDQCTEANYVKNTQGQTWNGKYCQVKASTYRYGYERPCNKSSPVGRKTQECSDTYAIKYGICAPNMCTQIDMQILMDIAFNQLNNSAGGFLCGVQVECHEKDLHLEKDGPALFMVVLLIVVAIMLFFGSVYDYCVYQPLLKAADSKQQGAIYWQQRFFVKTLLAFSLYTNAASVMSTSHKPGQIKCLHGIRFLSMAWIILGHTYYWSIPVLDNLAKAFELPLHLFNQIILNASFCVDAFFLLSGMLLTFLWFKYMHKTEGRQLYSPFLWLKFYLHRIIRLTPVYMVIVGIDAGLLRYMTDGPLWDQHGMEPNACRNSWWTNLFYVNNFFKLDELCMSWSWYLANDMQFHICAPILLILTWKYEILGGILAVSIVIISGLIKALTVVSYGWPPITIFSVNPDQFDLTSVYWDTLYVKPWIRCRPYIIGMMLGYLLYRRGVNAKMPKWVVLVGWTISTITALSILLGLFNYSKTGYISPAANFIYAFSSRTLWAFVLAWIIYACTVGQGGWVNSFLSWGGFIPLSRLTYCAYLIHPIMIFSFYRSRGKALHFTSHWHYVWYFLSFIVVAYSTAFILSLSFELPVMGMEKMIWESEPKEVNNRANDEKNDRKDEEDITPINGDQPSAPPRKRKD